MVRIILLQVFFIYHSVYAAQVAFLGDSLSTGGGAHPNILFESKQLNALLMGQESLEPDANYWTILKEQGFSFTGTEAPVRLSRSLREYQHPALWYLDNLWASFSRDYLDAEVYSWSYLLARQLGRRSDEIYIAAQNGERMAQGVRQVDRLLEATQGQLPKDIFIFFSGNDLCGLSFDQVTSADSYANQLRDLLRYMKLNGQPARGGTSVHVLNPLSVLQVVTSSSILNKEVPYQGGTLSCKNLQTLNLEAVQKPEVTQKTPGDLMELVVNLIATAPKNYCSSLFSIHDGDSEHQLAMSHVLSQYWQEIEKVVKEFNELAGSAIIVNHIQNTKELLFAGEDIANDCFHLSLRGHSKLAKLVLRSLEGK